MNCLIETYTITIYNKIKMKNIQFFILIAITCLFFCGCVQKYYNLATQEEEVYFYSSEKEIRIGKSLANQLSKIYEPNNDPLVQKHINEIGQKLVAVNDRKEINYYFAVLDGKQVNAFALPGGYVYIFKDLWDKVSDDDAQLAAVLAHEIAHIAARHSIKRLQSSLGYNALAILVGTNPEMNSHSRAKAISGINELILAYSRTDELQADVLACKYLEKAGYDPTIVVDVLKILQQSQREQPIKGLHARTHPYLTERMKAVKWQINRGNIGFDDYINTLE